jgi:hypothetical protein
LAISKDFQFDYQLEEESDRDDDEEPPLKWIIDETLDDDPIEHPSQGGKVFS